MDNEIILTFTGDIMCDNLEIMKKNSFRNFIDDDIQKRFRLSDYVVGNLEIPIVKDIENKKNMKYSFKAPIHFAQELRNMGIDLVSTANNHCLDCGEEGLKENIELLDEIGMEHIGTYKSPEERNNIFIKEIKGIKFAFISYTYGTNAFLNKHYLDDKNNYMVNLLKKQEDQYNIIKKIKDKFFENVHIYSYIRDKKFLIKVKKDIEIVKEKADIVIFCMHSGGQYNKKVEHYTRKLSNYIIKCGVNFIIGNHPHVVLDCKINKKMEQIYYSLGNFYATPFSNHNQKDEIPNYSILLNLIFNEKDKDIKKVTYSIAKTIIEPNGLPKTYAIEKIYHNSSKEDKIKMQNDIKRINKSFIKKEIWNLSNEYTILEVK